VIAPLMPHDETIPVIAPVLDQNAAVQFLPGSDLMGPLSTGFSGALRLA
jgi:hypothetical protein